MTKPILEQTKDLVIASIATGHLPPYQINSALHKTHGKLMALQGHGKEDKAASRTIPSLDWRKSIGQHAITCLECGRVYKQLGINHLREHDLTARAYRKKYHIPQTTPLASKRTTRIRRRTVQKTRPWEKAPTYIASQLGQ